MEDLEISVADHVQKVLKPNFAASWEELGESNELEDTYSLSMKTLEGEEIEEVVFARNDLSYCLKNSLTHYYVVEI